MGDRRRGDRVRALGSRQEALLCVMIEDTYRGRTRGSGLTDSVMLSLERRGLVRKDWVHRQDYVWRLTAEGLEAAQALRVRQHLARAKK